MRKLLIKALAKHLGCDENEITLSIDDDETFDTNEGQYLVVTDLRANKKWEEALDNHIEEVIMLEIPRKYQPYFNGENWKENERKYGRGSRLNSYNGTEACVTVEAEKFYIYRQN